MKGKQAKIRYVALGLRAYCGHSEGRITKQGEMNAKKKKELDLCFLKKHYLSKVVPYPAPTGVEEGCMCL